MFTVIKKSSKLVRIIFTIMFVVVLLSLLDIFTYSVYAKTPNSYTINKIQSGIVSADQLSSQQDDFFSWVFAEMVDWAYGGDAPLLGAPYVVFTDTQGLHIGVRAPTIGHWAGYYAVSPNTNAVLFHVVITAPVRTLPSNPSQFYENGMYVQTSEPFVNYVDCISLTNNKTTMWQIASVTGNATQGMNFHTLWTDPNPKQPLSRDCTIITNGSNYLKVYLDGKNVYTNTSLNLQMPEPFNVYLEPQSTYASQLLNGTYRDYYAATSEGVQVTNNPYNATTVKLVTSSGDILGNAQVNSGTAIINIGQYHFPLTAYIIVYDREGMQLASTSSPVKITAGDVYSVNPINKFFNFGIPFKF